MPGQAISRRLDREAIADAGFCLYEIGGVRRAAELVAELPDQDAKILHILGVGRSPYGGQDLPAGDDAARAADEYRQQVEFLQRQFQRPAVECGDMGREADGERTGGVEARFQEAENLGLVVDGRMRGSLSINRRPIRPRSNLGYAHSSPD